MEHLIRNAHNDKIICAIKNKKQEKEDTDEKIVKDLTEKTFTLVTGTLSAIAATLIVGYLKNEEGIEFSMLIICVVFLCLFFWFVLQKFLVPKFSKLAFPEKIDITPLTQEVMVQCFNREILPMIAEVTEILEVIKDTDINECKTLNVVFSLYKFQTIVGFMHEIYKSENCKIRESADFDEELLQHYFNIYAVAVALEMTKRIQKQIGLLIRNDKTIKKMTGIDLLEHDFNAISGKLDEIKIVPLNQ